MAGRSSIQIAVNVALDGGLAALAVPAARWIADPAGPVLEPIWLLPAGIVALLLAGLPFRLSLQYWRFAGIGICWGWRRPARWRPGCSAWPPASPAYRRAIRRFRWCMPNPIRAARRAAGGVPVAAGAASCGAGGGAAGRLGAAGGRAGGCRPVPARPGAGPATGAGCDRTVGVGSRQTGGASRGGRSWAASSRPVRSWSDCPAMADCRKRSWWQRRFAGPALARLVEQAENYG